MAQNAIEAIHVSISCLGLWLLCCVFVKDYRLDALRQRLFRLRGELFDYAASGAIAFDHPAYGMLRARINRLIRFAHRFTSTQLVLVLAFEPDVPTDPLKQWNSALATVESEAVQEALRDFNSKMFSILAWHMVTGSVVLMGSLVIFALCWTIKQVVERLTTALGEAITDLLKPVTIQLALEIRHDLFNSYVRRFPVEQLETQAYEAEDADANLQAA